MEYIGKYKNISFFNDSKSTNVNSSISAIESYKNIFWILGGRKKVGGLSGVEKKLTNILKSFTFGESGEEFKKFMNRSMIYIRLIIKILKKLFMKLLKKHFKKKTNKYYFFSMRIFI